MILDQWHALYIHRTQTLHSSISSIWKVTALRTCYNGRTREITNRLQWPDERDLNQLLSACTEEKWKQFSISQLRLNITKKTSTILCLACKTPINKREVFYKNSYIPAISASDRNNMQNAVTSMKKQRMLWKKNLWLMT